MTRRLLVLLAALTALTLASVASALAASGAQTRVWAQYEPGQVDAGLTNIESACSHQGSVARSAELASGFCVATEDVLPTPAVENPKLQNIVNTCTRGRRTPMR